MSARPLLLLALPLGAAWLYFRSSAPAQASVNADAGTSDTATDSAAAVPAIDLAPASVLTNIGAGVESVISAVKGWMLPARAAPYAATIDETEQANGIPAGLLGRLLYQESHFRADIINGTTRSSAGALGIAQIMPATAAELGVNPLDPYASIQAAGAYLRSLYDKLGSWANALAAYNWGIGNVQRKGIAAAPAETQSYVSSILSDINVEV